MFGEATRSFIVNLTKHEYLDVDAIGDIANVPRGVRAAVLLQALLLGGKQGELMGRWAADSIAVVTEKMKAGAQIIAQIEVKEAARQAAEAASRLAEVVQPGDELDRTSAIDDILGDLEGDNEGNQSEDIEDDIEDADAGFPADAEEETEGEPWTDITPQVIGFVTPKKDETEYAVAS